MMGVDSDNRFHFRGIYGIWDWFVSRVGDRTSVKEDNSTDIMNSSINVVANSSSNAYR